MAIFHSYVSLPGVNGFKWGITQHQKTVPEPPGTAQIAESAKEMEEKPPAMRASVLSAVVMWS